MFTLEVTILSCEISLKFQRAARNNQSEIIVMEFPRFASRSVLKSNSLAFRRGSVSQASRKLTTDCFSELIEY
jgi:hypothetical protein